jgi:hypothetical protein
MVAKTDLTFAELNTALGNDAITFNNATNDILISVKAITDMLYADLDADGVIAFIYKFRSACSVAQGTVNQNLAEGERLNSFPNFNFSAPVNGYSDVTQSHVVRIPLNSTSAIGRVI